MSQSAKMILSCVGVFIGGTGGYWQLHGDPGVLVTTPAFWIGFIMAGLVPLGAYFVGLVSKAPWEGTNPPAVGSAAPGSGGSVVSKLPVVLLCGLLLTGCAHALGYAGAHPGYVECKGKGTITGTGSASVGAGIGGAGMNQFSIQADCGDGFSLRQGPTAPATAPTQ